MTPEAALVRNATAEDYPAFVQLFKELEAPDPTPLFEIWQHELVATTKVACAGGVVVGYCYFEEYAESGYVRHLAVAPGSRRRGVARSLMKAVGDYLWARGKKTWRLNVKPGNVAAIELYTRFGLRVLYTSKALRFPWSGLSALPDTASRAVVLEPPMDAEFEELFSLPPGQLGLARAHGHVLLAVVASDARRRLGVAVFNPKFPGASPFHLREPSAVRAVLDRMYEHATEKAYVSLFVEDNPPLVALLESVGATVNLELLRMQGEIHHS